MVLHRCPELSDRDLATLMEPDVPAEIAAQVLDVVEALEQRLDELAETIANEDHDDDGADRRRAGQAGAWALSRGVALAVRWAVR